MKINQLLALVAVAFGLSAFSVRAQGEPPGFEHRPANIVRPEAGQTLTRPAPSAPAGVVSAFLRGRGASEATTKSLRSVSQNRVERTGITHVRLEQQIDGLTVYGAYVKAALTDVGELTHLIENVAAVPAGGLTRAIVSEEQALNAAMKELHPNAQVQFRQAGRKDNTSVFEGGAFFHQNPEVTRVAVPLNDGKLHTGFLVETWTKTGNLLHHTLVSGEGRILNVELRTNNDSYNVFIEDPLKGPQTVVSGPPLNDPLSPLGWLSTAVAQTSVNIKGNNVNAYLDVDANNSPDAGGSSITDGNFLTDIDLNAQPSTPSNKNVSVQNLFYLNNVIHDQLYAAGFVENQGNFQVDNFGKGGLSNDSVLAEAQDGSGTDNANFATPADGKQPRMQMYLWNPPGLYEVFDATHNLAFKAAGASFGAALTTTGVSGILALVNDGSAPNTDGCQASPAGSLSGKIVLIDRGTCNFTDKVKNAQNAGAVGVVIINNVLGNDAFTMGGSDRKVKIPSVMVGNDDGTVLKGHGGHSITLRLKSPAPPMLDGCVDSDIVFHEYGHGLTWRMIGGMSGKIAGAIGEGASDVNAFLMNGDDIMGEYSSSSAGGIRRYPYHNYPLTYKNVTGAEVHNDGEIYAAIIWRLSELVQDNDQLLKYVVDGMNYTPSTPTFENMRDGILQATPANIDCLVWQAFAQFGVGVGSSGTVSRRGVVTIVESFTVPSGCP